MTDNMKINAISSGDDTSPYGAEPIEDNVAQSYIVDMLEQLMLMAQEVNLKSIATGLDGLLEPYRE